MLSLPVLTSAWFAQCSYLDLACNRFLGSCSGLRYFCLNYIWGPCFCVALMVKILSWYWPWFLFLYYITRGFHWKYGLGVKDVEELQIVI